MYIRRQAVVDGVTYYGQLHFPLLKFGNAAKLTECFGGIPLVAYCKIRILLICAIVACKARTAFPGDSSRAGERSNLPVPVYLYRPAHKDDYAICYAAAY